MKARFVILSATLLCLTLAGCGDFKSEFSLNKTTFELIPPAQEVVAEQLDENFGTPEELVAWLKFPIEFGGEESLTVSVKSFEKSASGRLLLEDIAVEDQQFYDGGLIKVSDDQSYRISSFDAESGEFFVKPGIEVELKAGDPVTIVTKEPGWMLKRGRNLYMRHCLHCHGVSGDGAGPTAQYLSPLPRDYRKGIFKFTSTISTEKAARRDLGQTLYEGIPGTSMPSFKLKLRGDDMNAMIAYVRFLATRGEFEIRLGGEFKVDYGAEDVKRRIADKDDPVTREQINKEFQAMLDSDLADLVDSTATILSEDWERADSPDVEVWPKVPRPESTPESIARGRALYISKDAKCSDCHGMSAYGDGKQTEAYMQIPGSTLTYDKPGLYDDWGHPIKPRNLHQGVYRGGRRPIDIFRRISAGIKGTPMPGFGTSLKDEQIWDLVNYVLSVPYENNPSKFARAAEAVAEVNVK